ncbi:anti-sigma factor domain-containing protein [Metabacillus malikii]|uniref:Anti-sigma factor n=1 Tax=Metabacillus malikii TaxID=1504265 RepID=A0ABT9ZMD2_9BACI|nr:anti-sigma factor [Metabacillus malikii]MDQ0233446.1 hypothetical protein [Metabacillus malikii]
MSSNLHVTEQNMIDYLEGSLQHDEELTIKIHLQQCDKCSQTLMQWQSLLGAKQAKPSPLLKERIWESIEEKQKVKRSPSAKVYFITIGSIAAVLLLGLLSFNNSQSKLPNPNEMKVQAFQEQPHTQQMNITPITNNRESRELDGNIWINNTTDELLLEVYGLPKLNDRDYQLWMIYHDNEVKDEILPIEQNGSSRIFIRSKNLIQLKQIKASIEPKGGSHSQTGPDTFIIEINN